MPAAEWVEGAGPLWRALAWAPSRLYAAASSVRAAAYSKGWLHSVRVPVPVICVGNVTVGGAGKTPAVQWLTDHLKKAGRKPAVLSRGYGRRNSDVLTVSDGRSILPDARDVGDEPLFLAMRLAGVPVIVGADRALAARRAWEDLHADVLVMDDGYQHFRLQRKVNILCVDASTSRSIFNGAPLPSGLLRESPEDAVRRADVVLLSKANQAGPDAVNLLTSRIRALSSETEIVPVRYDVEVFDPAQGRALSPSEAGGRKALAMSGLARPLSFERSLEKLGMDVSALRYPDHHFFTRDELEAARRLAEKESRTLVVTEKDAVRLPPGFPVCVARLSWIPEAENDQWLKKIESAIS